MCKPGSASSGGGAASTGLGLAVVVLGAVALVSMAAAVISSILTAVLMTLIGVAAAGSILLVVQLYRTRGVMARPVSRRSPLARGRIQPARPRPGRRGRGPGRHPRPPAARHRGACARPCPDRRARRIRRPGDGAAHGALAPGHGRQPVPDLLLPVDVDGSPVPGLLLPPDRQQAPAARAEDVVTTR